MIPQKCVRIFWKDFAHFMTNAKNGTNISRNLIHLKQHLKIVKTNSNSPHKKIFIKKKRLSNSSPRKRFALAKVLNPFRIDRRPNQKILKRSITPRKSNQSRSSNKSIKHKLSPKVPTPKKTETPVIKTPAPPKPARKTPVKPKPSTTLINVQGVRYSISDNGRKLNRIGNKSVNFSDFRYFCDFSNLWF